MDDHQILGVVIARDTFPEDCIQPVGESGGQLLGGGGVTVSTQAGQFLDHSQFLDITGNGGLSAAETGLFQFLQQLLLGLHIGGGNDLQNFSLSLRFQSRSPFKRS